MIKLPRRIVYLVFAAAPLFALAAHGEDFYKWVDEKGETHFADSPSQIPPKYRTNAESKEFSKYRPSSTVWEQSERPQLDESPAGDDSKGLSQKDSTPHTLNVQALTDADFEKEIMKSGKPALVYFWAPWCGWCRKTAPNVSSASATLDGSTRVFAINTDESPAAREKLRIKKWPTFIMYSSGEEKARKTGFMTKENIITFAKAGAK
ncbi:MAG: DUF4124 domain-containing protein [Nitrospinae bacterium]|nr:DUF4124 domain-containing protein [Nitrospinota bacterium]